MKTNKNKSTKQSKIDKAVAKINKEKSQKPSWIVPAFRTYPNSARRYQKNIDKKLVRAHKTDAGYDVYATKVEIDWRRGIVIYSTDVRFDMIRHAYDYFIIAVPRSSLYKKSDLLCLTNSVGIIDTGYQGEIKFIYRLNKNLASYIRYKLKKLKIYQVGERIGQLIFTKRYNPVFYETRKPFNSKRGERGFGSTGDK